MTACCPPPSSSVTPAETTALKPRYTVTSDKESYTVQIEVPGATRDSVDINLDSNLLTVRAKRKASVPVDWKPLHRELNEQDYLLRLKLNVPVNESKMSAKVENGVLTLNLPVKEAAKPRRIEVS
jgi:HSP20 family protein